MKHYNVEKRHSFLFKLHDKTNKFLDRSGNIYIHYFYKYLEEHTEYEIEDFYEVFKGLLINTAYGVLTVNYEVLLEYSTHVPEIYYILEYITYGKEQKNNVSSN